MPADSDLIILDGCTFFYSDQNGDVEANEAEGLLDRRRRREASLAHHTLEKYGKLALRNIRARGSRVDVP